MAALTGLAAVDAATAQVTFFGVQKTAFYDQTANNTAPGSPANYSVFGFVNVTSASDATSFGLGDSGTGAFVILPSSPGNPTTFANSAFYGTAAELNGNFAPGDNYTFTASGGNLDGESGAIPVPADAYPGIEYLTGTGYSNSMAVSPNGSDTIALGSSGGTAASTALNFSLYDPANVQVYSANYDAGTTSITIPQSTIDSLKPDEVYTATLDNFNTSNVASSGSFTDAPDSDGFVSATNFDFEVVPEPAPSTLVLTALFGLAAALKLRAARRQA
jgi:hypothetical protein